jgi:hypothetical protein
MKNLGHFALNRKVEERDVSKRKQKRKIKELIDYLKRKYRKVKIIDVERANILGRVKHCDYIISVSFRSFCRFLIVESTGRIHFSEEKEKIENCIAYIKKTLSNESMEKDIISIVHYSGKVDSVSVKIFNKFALLASCNESIVQKLTRLGIIS